MSAVTKSTALARKVLLVDIGVKWSKFSEQELAELASVNDLVRRVIQKYDMDAGYARRDVDAVLKGRHF